jgi:hypothetical protein
VAAVELGDPADVREALQATHFVSLLLLWIMQAPHSQVSGSGFKEIMPLESTSSNSALSVKQGFFPRLSITPPAVSSVAGLMPKHISPSLLFLCDTISPSSFLSGITLLSLLHMNCTPLSFVGQFGMEVSTQLIFVSTLMFLLPTPLRGLLKVKLSLGKHVLTFSVTMIGEANLKVLVTAGLPATGGTTKSNFGRDVSGSEILGRFTASTVTSSSSFTLPLIFPACPPFFPSSSDLQIQHAD